MLSAGEAFGDSVRGGSVGSVGTAGTSFCSVVGPAADCSRVAVRVTTLFCLFAFVPESFGRGAKKRRNGFTKQWTIELIAR